MEEERTLKRREGMNTQYEKACLLQISTVYSIGEIRKLFHQLRHKKGEM